MPLETCPVFFHIRSAPSYNTAQAPSITKGMRSASKDSITFYALSQDAINKTVHSTDSQAAKSYHL
eukprot:1160856-Pelagomonas_calceolata.AAC.1